MALNRMYVRDAHAAIIVYDVTNAESFEIAEKWVEEVKEAAPTECLMVLVGNKMDADPKKHQVASQQAQTLANNNGILHCQEVSAKTNEGLSTLFHKVANLCYEKKDEFNITEVRGTFKINREAPQKEIGEKKKGCGC